MVYAFPSPVFEILFTGIEPGASSKQRVSFTTDLLPWLTTVGAHCLVLPTDPQRCLLQSRRCSFSALLSTWTGSPDFQTDDGPLPSLASQNPFKWNCWELSLGCVFFML